jgi:hypothetical protein
MKNKIIIGLICFFSVGCGKDLNKTIVKDSEGNYYELENVCGDAYMLRYIDIKQLEKLEKIK